MKDPPSPAVGFDYNDVDQMCYQKNNIFHPCTTLAKFTLIRFAHQENKHTNVIKYKPQRKKTQMTNTARKINPYRQMLTNSEAARVQGGDAYLLLPSLRMGAL